MPIATRPSKAGPYHEPDYHGAPAPSSFYSGRGPSMKQHDYSQPPNGYSREERLRMNGPEPQRMNDHVPQRVMSDHVPQRMNGHVPQRVMSDHVPQRMNGQGNPSVNRGNSFIAPQAKRNNSFGPNRQRLNGAGPQRMNDGGTGYDSRKSVGNDGKTEMIYEYHVEHLCTFSMDRKDAVLNIEDALRKLKLMDAKGKIWSQDVTLHINDKDVRIIDDQTQEVLETFPMSLVSLVSAELNQCSYNSVLVIQLKFPQKKSPDMFLFQCDIIQADVIAKELQLAVDYTMGRKKRIHRQDITAVSNGEARERAMSPSRRGRESRYNSQMDREMDIPPPPDEPAPLPPNDNTRNRVAAFAAAAEQQRVNGAAYQPRLQQPKSIIMAQAGNMKDNESIEIMAIRTERDVQILNHCFDEIEGFIGSLQKAADAYTELTRRRRQRKSKKREHGDGLLISRSRPPPESDYVDCFQKFKFSFNLLAKLKAHIHDPNAPELIHFLLIPLELVVQSCQGPELAASVVSPLLTPQAIELLRNCLTSRENDLWISLGRAWNTPKSAWPKDHYVPSYTPQFHDGWIPPQLPDSQAQDFGRIDSSRRNYGQALPQQPGTSAELRNGESAYTSRQGSLGLPPSTNPTPPPVASNQQAQALSVNTTKKNIGKATFDFVARNSKELTIMAGEILEIIDDRRKWWEVCNSSGQQGFVPSTILEVTIQPNTNASNSNNRIPTPPQQSPSGFGAPGSGKSLYHHHHNSQPQVQEQVDSGVTSPAAPAPPPAPALPPVAPVFNGMPLKTSNINPSPVKNGRLYVPDYNDYDYEYDSDYDARSTKTRDDLHDELMRRVSQGQRRNFNIARKSTNLSVPLTHNSSPNEVSKWLQSKQFSKLTVDSLGVLTGAQLFSLTKEELKQVCFDDGARVYSQVMVARSAQEQQSTTSELAAIMERRKVRSYSNDSGSLEDNIPLNNPPPNFNPALPL